MRRRYLLLLVPLLAATRARAQSPGVYTAPGKALRVQRGLPGPYAPAKPPVILPRYWREADSARLVAQYRSFLGELGRHLRYPDAVLERREYGEEIPSGRFLFRVVIGADGTSQPPRLIARTLTLAESVYRPSDVQALEAAATQALKALRFAPAAQPDTLTIPITFPRRW